MIPLPSVRNSLSSKTVLITGAAGLLGAQHTIALLEIGASVIMTDVSDDALLVAKNQICSQGFDPQMLRLVNMDVTSKTSIESAGALLRSSNTRVDVLINNAALNPQVSQTNSLDEQSRLESFSLDTWNRELNVGLTGAFLCSQYFGSLMAHDRLGGVILNISSDLSVIAPDQRLYTLDNREAHLQPVKPVTYSVIKTGLIGLTRYLASYWPDGLVRCNALSPGGVFHEQPPSFVDRISPLIPLGRMARQDEYRSAVQFLCSDASSYMTGQNLVIDGGRSVI